MKHTNLPRKTLNQVRQALLLSMLMVSALVATSQTVSIHGSVSSIAAQTGLEGQTVYFLQGGGVDSLFTQTDAEGHFSKTLTYEGDSMVVWVGTIDPCSGKNLMEFVGPWNVADGVHFQVCDTIAPNNCQAAFADSVYWNRVYFFDYSTGANTQWFWDFGDGQTSTERYPIHTYAHAGTFWVTLHSAGSDCESSYSDSVLIASTTPDSTVVDSIVCRPYFSFHADTTALWLGTADTLLTYQFYDQSQGDINQRTWDFGDGQTSTSQYPVHTFAHAGTYQVTLTISGDRCESSYSAQVVVDSIPPIVVPEPIACAARFAYYADSTAALQNNNMLQIQFYDLSQGNANQWAWDFGDGQTSTEQYPAHTFASEGTYQVTLSISGDSCQSSYTASVVVTNLPPVVEPEPIQCMARFAYYADSTAALQNNNVLRIQFIDHSQGNIQDWAWDFGDGQTSTEQYPMHTYSNAGTYQVTLTISGDRCESTYTASVQPAEICADMYKSLLSVSKTKRGGEQLVVYPNPIGSKANIRFYGQDNQTASILLIDLNGKVVSSRNVQVVSGPNNFEMDTEHISKGIYVLRIVQANQVQSITIIKD